MVIVNSNYRFGDSDISSMFEPVNVLRSPDSDFVVKFDSKGNRLIDQNGHAYMYRKDGNYPVAQDDSV
jgi:hypothetical protein